MKIGFIKSTIKKGQKGLTLVELMVVMSILAVLAAIVFPAVSGTQEVSKGSQVKQDASTVANAVSDSFKDQVGAEIVTPKTVTILTTTGIVEKTSTRWPELYISGTGEIYAAEFPTAAGTGKASALVITDKNNTKLVDTAASTAITAEAFVEARQAIDMQSLADDKYMPSVPKSFTDKSGTYHNFLWLVKRTSSAGGSDDSRQVEVYRLVRVESTGTASDGDALTYEQVY
ncbi:MAG: prepilin-type N-terminal cleavage/methylation domain-containing protein [Chloroflexi bacterium]|nr:prepilin-type N-terminal cleavage/methylation domain-containing protein [Chloroflexota bacterium]